MRNAYWLMLNLYWFVIGASLYMGFKAYPWHTIPILALVSVGFFFVIDPQPRLYAAKKHGIVGTLVLSMVSSSLIVGLFFIVGRAVGHIVA